jgi:hypothetical protein
VLFLINKNISYFIWDFSSLLLNNFASLVLFLISFYYLVKKRLLAKRQAIFLALWVGIYILFFSIYSKAVSEYYLNGMFAVYLVVFSLLVGHLFANKKTRTVAIALLLVFGIKNLYRFFKTPPSGNGYLQKQALVAEIKKDSARKDYPCLAVSYITSPGYELGYRYFFYRENVLLNKISAKIPVYTIVFPLGKDEVKEDKAFGALGLIYPDDKRYPLEEVKKNCSAENINLSGDMFGYTQ